MTRGIFGKDSRAAQESAGLPGSGSQLAVEAFDADVDSGVATGFSDFLRRFGKNKLAVLGTAIILFWVMVAIFGPLFVNDPTDPRAVDFSDKFRGAFSPGHVLGTDDRGRDLLARTVYGARVSMAVGAIATLVSLVLGVLLGALAGMRRGVTDAIIMRLADIFFAFPYILGTLAIITVMENGGISERGFVPVFVSIGVLSWAYFARLLRGQLLALRELDYVTAARAAGAGSMWIFRKHLLPNALPLMIVFSALNIGTAVLAEASLSFLGAGIQEPDASWGLMLSEATDALGSDNWFMVPPGLALTSLVFAFIAIGDGLRAAFDPRLREVSR